MAIQQYPHPQSSSPAFLLDALYCEETEHWVEDDGYEERDFLERETEFLERESYNTAHNALKFSSLVLFDQDLIWEDDELDSLSSKEQQQLLYFYDQNFDPFVLIARKEAVDWILKVKAHFGFSALTAILAINYLDRFISTLHFQKDNPWMIQLVSVTCLSLAAKVEETQVPLLIDLQVDAKYLFEAKNIQKMELLVMSTLEWKMNPVTPISFLDHIIRRLGLKTHLHWEFYKTCEALILSLVSESRFAHYLPSVLATATMFHVIGQFELSNPADYQRQLLDVLKNNKEKVKECYVLIAEVVLLKDGSSMKINGLKRTYEDVDECSTCPERSPNGVIDADFNSESSNDSRALIPNSVSSLSSSSSPDHYDSCNHNDQTKNKKKKKRLVHEQSKISRVFVVDAIGSPHSDQ